MRLSHRQPDGSTLRAHLQAAASAGIPTDPMLLHRAPPAAAVLWDAFVALNGARHAGMQPGPILPSEVLAWQQLMGLRLTPWEADTLLAMDRAALAASAKETRH